jgi:isocitrate dehydrogenase kinase/phosphatase
MDLATLQTELPWTDRFSESFQRNPDIIKDFRHALDHVDMASGDLRKIIHAFEHGNLDGQVMNELDLKLANHLRTANLAAQLVLFAVRLAQTWPGGFDLCAAVEHELAIRKQHAAMGH